MTGGRAAASSRPFYYGRDGLAVRLLFNSSKKELRRHEAVPAEAAGLSWRGSSETYRLAQGTARSHGPGEIFVLLPTHFGSLRRILFASFRVGLYLPSLCRQQIRSERLIRTLSHGKSASHSRET